MTSTQASRPSDAAETLAVVLRDNQDHIPIQRILSRPDVIVLLTPVAAPPPDSPPSSADPFEILGRSIARRHPLVRHVPYTKRGGITGTHVAFVKRAKLVIFVISGPANPSEPSQADLAEMARIAAETRPMIVAVCSPLMPQDLVLGNFPAIIQSRGYACPELEALASVLFGGKEPSPLRSVTPPPPPPPPQWYVVPWHPSRDIQSIYEMWCKILPPKYHLNRFVFGTVLQRDGWAKHWVVRDGERIVGFCGTYTTYADSDSENLVGSLAVLLVHPEYRRRGIGTLLHSHALAYLRKTRGVCRLQLGSTFPRLFYGVPTDFDSLPWFRNLGWDTDFEAPGQGEPVSDWLLHFSSLPAAAAAEAILPDLPGLAFRTCELDEFRSVVDVVKRETVRHDHMMGWFDQYTKLDGTMEIQDIMMGIQDGRIVATALTYEPGAQSPTGQDLPWAGTIQGRIGGITCVCIPEEGPDASTYSREAIMTRLLDACVRSLRDRSCTGMFIDSVKRGHEGFQYLGFQEWTQYREVWKNL